MVSDSSCLTGQVRQHFSQRHVLNRALGADADQRLIRAVSPQLARNRRQHQRQKTRDRPHDVTTSFASTPGKRWALMKRLTYSLAGKRIISSSVPCCTISPPPKSTTVSPKKPASPISCVTSTT